MSAVIPVGMTSSEVRAHYAGMSAPSLSPDMRKCANCGTWAKPGAFHYPGNNPENDSAHRQVDTRTCYHCDKPARADSDLCQDHYTAECEGTRARVCCAACEDQAGGAMHDLCEGCQCQKEGTDCDPWVTNAQIDATRPDCDDSREEWVEP